MGQRKLTRDIEPLSIRAAVRPRSLNEDARTVEVVWGTEERVLRRSIFDSFYEELSFKRNAVRLDRLRGGAPVLDSHRAFETQSAIGVVESAKIEGRTGIATLRFARAEDDEEADRIFRKIADGVLRQVSVGYRIHRLEKVEDSDDGVPVYRATDWEPMEISVVPIGADSQAQVRSGSAEPNPCEIVEHEDDDPTEDKRMGAKTQQDPQGGAPAAPPPAPTSDTDTRSDAKPSRSEDEIRMEERRAERERVADIQRYADTLGVSGDDLVRDEVGLDQARAKLLERYAEQKRSGIEPGGRVEAVDGGDATEKLARGATDWMLVRAGAAPKVEEHSRKRGETYRADPGEFRGMTLSEVAQRSLEAHGIRTAGMDKMTMLQRALAMRAGGYHTTSDFPTLLENVMHKTLLAEYDLRDTDWRRFCTIGSVSDFRPHNRYRVAQFGRLEKLNEHGEFRNKPIDDGEKESIQADTEGNIISISRKTLINDDLDAFVGLSGRLGGAAAYSIEEAVFDMIKENNGMGPKMSSGNPLFHSSHNNVAGQESLSVAGLEEDRIVLAEQMDPGGNRYLNLRPDILLVPMGLGGEARVINAAEWDVDEVASDSTNKFHKPNKVRGLFTTIIDTPRLSGNRRYVLASPQVAPVFEVAFLNGQQEPFLEMQEGWRIDGVEWKVRLDYGVAAVDFRGAVTNEG